MPSRRSGTAREIVHSWLLTNESEEEDWRRFVTFFFVGDSSLSGWSTMIASEFKSKWKWVKSYQISVFRGCCRGFASSVWRGTSDEKHVQLLPVRSIFGRSTGRNSLSASDSLLNYYLILVSVFTRARPSKIGSEFLSLPCSATDWPQNIHIFVFIVFLTQFQNIYGTICLSLVFVSLSVCHSARFSYLFFCIFLRKCVFAAPHFLCCLINVRETFFIFFFCTNRHIIHIG